jgi:uncharacterized protein
MLPRSLFPASTLMVATLALAGCGEKPVAPDEFNTRLVKLPSGRTIRAEIMVRPEDMMRGMMFRDSLEPDRGMLFIHRQPGINAYWMYQVRIPLDIIWMDRNRMIVEISPNTPPCSSKSARECPSFGGHVSSQYVLELAGGMAAKYNLLVGEHLDF